MRILSQAALAVLFLATSVASAALASPPPAPEEARVQRLASLGRLWGDVRYGHPSLASGQIDWDRALVESIPRVDAARNPPEFRRAVDGMLAALRDPATRTLDPAESAPGPERPRPEPLVTVADGIVRADLARMAETADGLGSPQAVSAQVEALGKALPGARVLVLDARASRAPDEDWTTPILLSELVMNLSSLPLRQGALRYRSYSGYPAQTGTFTSRGFFSGLMTETAQEIPGRGAAPLPPIVLVTNARSVVPAAWLAGMQASGRLWWVAEGSPGALDATPVTRALAEGVQVQVRSTEVVSPDGHVGLAPDSSAAAATVESAIATAVRAVQAPGAARKRAVTAGIAPPVDQDRPYAEMTFPSREYRLLALFRFRAVLDKFFAYRPLIGPGWDDLVQRYIPRFEANRDAADYQMTIRQLIAETHDSHARVRTPMLASAERLGRRSPPVLVDFVEGQSVVVHVLEENTGLRVGDAIVRVDGRPVAELRERAASVIAASTPQALQRDLHRDLLRGQLDSTVVLDVTGSDGVARSATLKRNVAGGDARVIAFVQKPRPQPVFGVLPGGIGYVDLDRLTPAQVDEMFAAIKDTRATIFDMRGYPKGTAATIAPRLGTRVEPVGARFRRAWLDGFAALDSDRGGKVIESEQRVPKAEAPPYLGKVVMLINERTQSQAEHAALHFEAMTQVTFIGSPTAGANGTVTEMVLPGGLAVAFSGHDVRHGDGRQLQRVGLQPHVQAAPTIAGLVRGEDEVLAAALAWLDKQR